MSKHVDIRAVAESSGLQLGDLVEYDSRTVQFSDGPQAVPGGRGRLRDVWAADGEAVTRVEHEDGTSGTPLLVDLRPAAETPARTVPPVAPAPRTVTVTTEFIGRSIPTRLRAAGAPGAMKHSSTAGALRWVLPDGEELTPGEAAARFLRD
ncbi:hypothetical protein ACIP93_33585 [Streptomyces sp. NPDC088745]|uniref:hypothetical protein n=1 Tax=Streptomyces sp. NPDC088745 TaxID=3365884 RepID=UPI0038026831